MPIFLFYTIFTPIMSNKLSSHTIQSLQQGSHKAFEEVFMAYFTKVKCYILQLIRSESEAEELAQDVFVRLWANHPSIQTDKSFDTYLFAMAHNAACNYLKHRLVRDNYEAKAVPDEFTVTPEEILYAKEISLLIEMTVNQMPEQRKRIFRMSRNEGYSNDDIAQELQITKKTVENQLSLALKELRKVISVFLLFMG